MKKETMLKELETINSEIKSCQTFDSELFDERIKLVQRIETIDMLPTCEDELLTMYELIEERERIEKQQKQIVGKILSKLGFKKGVKFMLDDNMYLIVNDCYSYRKLNKNGTLNNRENATRMNLYEAKFAKIVK